MLFADQTIERPFKRLALTASNAPAIIVIMFVCSMMQMTRFNVRRIWKFDLLLGAAVCLLQALQCVFNTFIVVRRQCSNFEASRTLEGIWI